MGDARQQIAGRRLRDVSQEEFTPAGSDDSKVLLANKGFDAICPCLVRNQIVFLLSRPQVLEFGIVQKNRRSARSSRTILHIVEVAVQEQGILAGIKNDRREEIVVAIDDELSRGCRKKRLRKRTRRKIRIEKNKGQARGLKEHTKHKC